jgi:hypothetical protein
VLKGRNRKLIYPKGVFQLRRHLKGISLVHAHYAYVGAVARTQWKVPVVLTYHGDDALGTVTERGTTEEITRDTGNEAVEGNIPRTRKYEHNL